ncbi:GH25 family lysozyme [Soonwooa sp.]|uniref:glycoside hydrolase family 25 protein n=1 Tax=Soonwooa sp. TaxID=1938592 RepID=UPI0028AB9BBE|nr:GH25 family lysozyme [Soonwooa sp.]
MKKAIASQRKSRKKQLERRQLKKKIMWWTLTFAILGLLGTGYYLKEKIHFYYSIYFNKFHHKKLKNSKEEEARINRIIGDYATQTFGFDISHYQNKKDIKWDSLSIGNKTIPLKFVLLRATMGNKKSDKNFEHFWEQAKKHELLRGAYHFYRPDEDPILQANSFVSVAKLESGDLPPVLDIEKMPRHKSKEQLIKDLKLFVKILEDAYGAKPIIYTYYHYKKDVLADEFDDYTLWLANYNDVPAPSPEDNWKFWQFTENGIAYGINVKVDLNVYNGSYWSLRQLTLD